MKTAELIIKVLDAAKEYYSELNDDPIVKPYADFARERYRILRRTNDFRTASNLARIEVIERIIQENK